MVDESNEAAPASADAPEGVFGNLPSSRPGSRSPRRPEASASEDVCAEAAPEPPAETPEPAAPRRAPETPPPNTPTAEPQADPEGVDPLAPQPGIHGVEDLAWAGVAAVAQAATAGIRFTSRALEAARKSIDRP